jgi:Uma2 family endonuclease
MATVILDSKLADRLRAQRAEQGGDRYDEVWEGTYMMAPMPNNEHQGIVNGFTAILQEIVGWPQLGDIFPGVNVSDRQEQWEENYRIPDVAVFMKTTSAVNRGSFWQGGPDFAVEILSPGDKGREKLGFYASVNTAEVLVLDRNPWQLELYRLTSNSLQLTQTGRPDESQSVQSDVVGLSFELRQEETQDRPSLIVKHPASSRTWTI